VSPRGIESSTKIGRLGFGALIAAALMLSLVFFSTSARAARSDPTTTIVLVHGAFASPAGWDRVAAALHKDGYQTATPARPGALRRRVRERERLVPLP
jgi:pimeloyl-ACP methyl ester carboxylesterase